MTDDWPYTLEQWPVGKLYVDKTYQRPLTSLAAKIAADLDLRMLAPIVISVRKKGANGAIVDGQTRWQACKMLGRATIPALVFRGTQEEEAALFARFQSERRSIRPFHRYRAALVGQDPVALKVDRLVRKHGYEVGDVGATVKPWTITAVRALEKLADGEQLDLVLTITSQAWPPPHDNQKYGAGHPITNDVLGGIAAFLREQRTVDTGRLIRALASSTPQELALRAGHLRQGRGMGGGSHTYMRQVIADLYVRDRPGGRMRARAMEAAR